MKKRLLLLITVVAMLVAMIPVATWAASSEASYSAGCLYDMGLFKGTGYENGKPVFELDRTPTRAEAVVMLVRLLGKEDTAKNGSWSVPFTDVKAWAKPYVGYAYSKGLVNGISKSTFGSDNPATAKDYLSFVLRALGYSEGTEFTWENPFTLSNQIGLTYGNYSNKTSNFTRGDTAIISYYALATVMKNEQTLYDYLNSIGAIGKESEAQSNVVPKDTSVNTDGMTYMGEYSLTFYCPCAKCCGHANGNTASGTKPAEGRTIAVDRNKIPLGSKVYIEGWGTYIAEDTGGAIKSNRIDIFVNSHSKALQYGRKSARVWVQF